jgi:hypothetical protein
MKKFVVFYAWQSDRLQRFNRHLIRFALNLAAKNISNDPTVGIQVRIDADTENVLGHIPVTDTILKKIGGCDAFVPDLTFVAATGAGKLTPNPNVMLEYGYALRAKTYSVMVPVMNTAYGPPEQLPFDMAHLRYPLQYDLPVTATNGDRRTVRNALAGEIERILRLMIAEAPAPQATPFQEAKPVGSPAFFFPRSVAIATVGFPSEQEYRYSGERAIYLRVFHKYGDGQPRPGRATIRELLQNRRVVNPMSLTIGGIASANDLGWVVIDPASNSVARGITQAFPTGELWGINAQAFTIAQMAQRGTAEEEPETAIAIIAAERILTRALENYVSVARSEMNLQLPFVGELGAVGLRNVYMGAPHPEFSAGDYYGPIRETSLVRRYELADTEPAALFDILRDFFNEFYDLAECTRSEILSDQHVSKNCIAPRT